RTARVSLRTRLALVFIAATLIPLGATVWVTTALLDRSLRLSPVDQLSGLSRSLETTGREYYQQACEQLKADALAGRAIPAPAPSAIADFKASDDQQRFVLTGDAGSVLLYLVKTPKGVSAWQRPLGVRMQYLSQQYSNARRTVSGLAEL